MSLNKVILIGHVGQDPEIKSFPDGNQYANFSIATSEKWKDKSTGERKEKTEWHRISVMNTALAGIVQQYVKKGDQIYVEGKLQARSFTDKQTNQEKTIVEVVLPKFGGELKLLSSKGSGGGTAIVQGYLDAGQRPTGSKPAAGLRDYLDDDISFL